MDKATTLIYVGSPYTHADEKVALQRLNAVTRFCGQKMKDGFHVFSPITHGVPIAESVELSTEWDFWKDDCTLMLSKCDKLIVLQLDGWVFSKGLQAEVNIARELGLEIEYVRFEI